jgi:predicted DNA-binding transcriptional regulator YafY
MNQVERLYKIEQLMGEAHTVPIAAMLERLEISRATFKRDLATLRDRLNAPIVWDRFGGG